MVKHFPFFISNLSNIKKEFLMIKEIAGTELKTISILGCGWYGFELAKTLVSQGYMVKGSSTTTEKMALLSKAQIQPFLVSFEEEEESYDPNFFQCDILFVCIPPKRSAGQQLSFSKKIARICSAAKDHQTKHLVFISSTAVYGDCNAEATESNAPNPDSESGKVILEAENLLKDQSTFTCTIIRFAGLVGPGRDPGRFFAGKTGISNGQAPVNLIHLKDCIGLSLKLIKEEIFGHTYNACSPSHPSRQDFYTAASTKSGLTLPLFKDELQKWKLVSSIHIPQLLHYNYQVSDWMNWLHTDNL